MKFIKKIVIFLVVVLVVFSLVAYIDYFLVKMYNKAPTLSIKSENKEKGFTLYKAMFYKVWICDSDSSITIGSYSDADAVCTISYEFKDGYYVNASNYKITQRDMKIITTDNIYTREMIDVIASDNDIFDAVYVAYNYYKNVPKLVNKTTYDKTKLVVFPEIVYKNNLYEWEYDTEDESKYYCEKTNDKGINIYSKYINGVCDTNYEQIKMDQKWCSLYKNSTLVYDTEKVKGLCEE